MSFTEDEVEQCILLEHRVMKLIQKTGNDIGFAVLMTILLKSVANEHNRKEDFMDSVSQSWDRHVSNIHDIEQET